MPQGTPVAWSYTHHKMDRARLAALRTLASVGVHVRRSDHLGHNGVVVMPFAEVVGKPAFGWRSALRNCAARTVPTVPCAGRDPI
jgi:hypothetical protein